LIILAIENGDFIKVSYTGKFEGGLIFDTTDEELAKENQIFNPRGVYGGDVVVVGAGHTIKGLDEDFVGKDVGYKGELVIPPEKGFGEHAPKQVETISLNKFEDRKATPGMGVEIEGKRGVVTKVIGRRARVDFNHPLAGKEVTYEYTIDEKLEGDVDKINGLLSLYTGVPEIEVEVEDKTAIINIPVALSFNQRWLMSKNRIASEIIENIGMEQVKFVETYPVGSPASAEEEEAESEDYESGEE